MSEQSWVQFPNFEREIEADETNRLGVERIAEPKAWLNETQLSIIFEPFNRRHELPAELKDEKRETGWSGEWHWVQEQVTDSLEHTALPDLARHEFALMLKRHNYSWDSQAMPGAASEAVLLQKSPDSDQITPVAAILVKDKDASLQQFVVNGENGWEAADETSRDAVISYLYVMHRLAINASLPDSVDNRGETS